MKHNYFTEVSLFFLCNSTSPLYACLILARFLQLSWQKLSCWILLAVELVTSQVLCHWSKNNSPVGKVSTIYWIFLKFPVIWLQQILGFFVHCMGLIYCAQGSYLMTGVMPMPANNLMQSAEHVTAFVHIRFFPLYFLWVQNWKTLSNTVSRGKEYFLQCGNYIF